MSGSKTAGSVASAVAKLGLRLPPIDSHLHVWSTGAEPFPFASNQSPPPAALSMCQAEHLIALQNECGVGGALIVQPINHGFDHSYVLSILKNPEYGHRFKGMCLLDPTLSTEAGIDYLKALKSEGFVGVRFNPYLWPTEERMGAERGLKLFAACGQLGMPVGFMCFKGLSLHYEDIVRMIEASPSTVTILDHWGFFYQKGVDSSIIEKNWQQLLTLAQYPQVYVKISALFRVSAEAEWPFLDLDLRLAQLIKTFGPNRLMWGSDYPFVQQNCGYEKCLSALAEWTKADECVSKFAVEHEGEEQKGPGFWDDVFRGTVETVFGAWPDS